MTEWLRLLPLDKVKGQRRLYALRPEPFRELDAWLAGYRRLWEARLDRFGAALEERRKERGATRKEPRK